MNKIKIYHFHNGSGGGVLSVIRNLLSFSKNPLIENHLIYTINKEKTPNFVTEKIEGAVTEQVFYYSPKWNFYHTCKQLAALLPSKEAIVVAHDWLELGMVSNLGLQNKVIQIVHGNYDYYYDLALRHSPSIDCYICISKKIYHSLKEKLQARASDIHFMNFPVPYVQSKKKVNDNLNIIYFVRDLQDSNKQFSTIIDIAVQLGEEKLNYHFTIAGSGFTKHEFLKIWPEKMSEQVSYLGNQDNTALLSLIPSQDIFILPSIEEGLPISLVETMKAGVVPLISNWDGAVEELVIEGFTGFYFKVGDAISYANCIRNLRTNPKLLDQLSRNCIITATKYFDPVMNTDNFEKLYQEINFADKKIKKPFKTYGSRLDQIWLGNFITLFARTKFKSR